MSENNVYTNSYGSAHKNKFPTQDLNTKIYSTDSAYDFHYFGR